MHSEKVIHCCKPWPLFMLQCFRKWRIKVYILAVDCDNEVIIVSSLLIHTVILVVEGGGKKLQLYTDYTILR
jgi:hypothetical protein